MLSAIPKLSIIRPEFTPPEVALLAELPTDVVALTTAVTSVITPVRLTVASEEGVLILTWPTSGSGILESTSTLTAGPWAKVNSAPVQSGQNWKVTVPMESATQFYRLRSP